MVLPAQILELKNLYLSEQDRLDPHFDKYPWEEKEAYIVWCGQMYYFIRNATRLLASAAARLGVDNDQLHWSFCDHIQEEKHHEKLLVNDLRRLDSCVEDIPEYPEVAAVYQM
jgi:hypothetical protein